MKFTTYLSNEASFKNISKLFCAEMEKSVVLASYPSYQIQERQKKLSNQHFLFKLNNGNTKIIYEIYTKSTIKTTEECQYCRFGAFIVNFKADFINSSDVSVFDFEQVNAGWASICN